MKKISDFLEKSDKDDRQVVKSIAVLGEVIAIEEFHERVGDSGKPYVSVYFHFPNDVEKTPYCWNTSSTVIMDQLRKLKEKGAFDDSEPVLAKVWKKKTKAGLVYYTLVDPEEDPDILEDEE